VKLDTFVAAAKPKGKSAKTLLSSVKADAQTWHTLMANQQWRELSTTVGRVLKRMRKSEDAGTVADAPLLNQLDGYLDSLQKAAQAAE